MAMEYGQDALPRVLIFPIPLQGHVNSMLKLAELLALSGVQVTFINFDHNHDRLLRYSDVLARFSRYSGFEFKTISDGFFEDYDLSLTGADLVNQFVVSILTRIKPLFRDLLVSCQQNGSQVSCIIADGSLGVGAIDVANELGIPIYHFHTISACSHWVYFRGPEILEAGELSIKGEEEKNGLIKSVPGMETFLRYRDLPNHYRVDDVSDPSFKDVFTDSKLSSRANGLILNTFEELESPILSQVQTQCPNIYTIGPLHAHLNTKLFGKKSLVSSNSFFKQDRACMRWLDSQPPKSVIYVSFGSITTTTRDQLMEFWYGLVNSNQRFLWVRRPGSVEGDLEQLPEELKKGTDERGYIAEWVPQEEVLVHEAIAGFLTHSGWNSTLESVVAGVPMLCWPYFADQHVNSRFVDEVWKIGIDMKDICERVVIEKMIVELMVEKRDEFQTSVKSMAALARKSISEGGSSVKNLNRLIQDINSTTSKVVNGSG